MEKQIRKFDVNFKFDWTYGIEISKLRADLDELEKLGATHIDIEASVSHNCPSIDIYATCERLETDDEFKARVDEKKRFYEMEKSRELNRLQKKYKK